MKIRIEDINIRRLDPSDLTNFIDLTQLFNEVFETGTTGIADEAYLHSLLKNPDFIAFAIFHNDIVVGGATAYALPMYASKTTELFIYDIAVHRGYQRCGLGTKLIAALKTFCRENGNGEMFVLAHEGDTHALNFYRATGGKPEKVVNFIYLRKE